MNDKENIHKLKLLKFKVWWAIDQMVSTKSDRFSVGEITNYLIEKAGVSTSQQAVRYAINSDKPALHNRGGKYKLMNYGKTELEQCLQKHKMVLFLQPGKPFSKKREITKTTFMHIKGPICMCDPYCGCGILDLIYKSFNPKFEIKILTQQIIDKPTGSFKRALKDIREEGYNIKVKILKNGILHDRYIIGTNEAWLSGYGFNDLGKKESFMVKLSDDMRNMLSSTFGRRWKIADEYR